MNTITNIAKDAAYTIIWFLCLCLLILLKVWKSTASLITTTKQKQPK